MEKKTRHLKSLQYVVLLLSCFCLCLISINYANAADTKVYDSTQLFNTATGYVLISLNAGAQNSGHPNAAAMAVMWNATSTGTITTSTIATDKEGGTDPFVMEFQSDSTSCANGYNHCPSGTILSYTNFSEASMGSNHDLNVDYTITPFAYNAGTNYWFVIESTPTRSRASEQFYYPGLWTKGSGVDTNYVSTTLILDPSYSSYTGGWSSIRGSGAEDFVPGQDSFDLILHSPDAETPTALPNIFLTSPTNGTSTAQLEPSYWGLFTDAISGQTPSYAYAGVRYSQDKACTENLFANCGALEDSGVILNPTVTSTPEGFYFSILKNQGKQTMFSGTWYAMPYMFNQGGYAATGTTSAFLISTTSSFPAITTSTRASAGTYFTDSTGKQEAAPGLYGINNQNTRVIGIACSGQMIDTYFGIPFLASSSIDYSLCRVQNFFLSTLPDAITALVQGLINGFMAQAQKIFPFSVPIRIYNEISTAASSTLSLQTDAKIEIVMPSFLKNFNTSTRSITVISSSTGFQSDTAANNLWMQFQTYLLTFLFLVIVFLQTRNIFT